MVKYPALTGTTLLLVMACVCDTVGSKRRTLHPRKQEGFELLGGLLV